MKLFIVLAVVGLSSCAKLDRTYLPPHSQTSGGSANFLQTPNYSGAEANNFAQGGNGFAQNGNAFPQNGNGFTQNGNAFTNTNGDDAQSANGLAQNNNGFNNNDFTQNSNDFGQGSKSFAQNDEFNAGFSSFDADRPERPMAALERTAAILRQDSQNDGETYSYSFETENGISAEENGVATNGVEAQGGFSYTGDDGQFYSIRYTADQNGFVPQGEHLPTPPPIPEEILKALEQNARDEAAGIFDDGSYHEGKYSDNEDASNGNLANGNTNFANNQANNYNNGFNANQNNDFGNANNAFVNGNNNFGNGNGNFAGNDDTVVTDSAAATYLPPVENQRAAIRNQRPETPVYRQPATNGVTNAYIPPRNQAPGASRYNTQRAPQRSSSFGQRENIRRPSFNARDGYQY